MKLKKLIKGLNIKVKGSREIEITGICSHSQFVTPGNVFIAKRGKTFDAAAFIPEAIRTGAVAILTDIYNPFLQGVTQLITPELEEMEAIFAKRYYETEKSPLYTIGITGTNGKTTTAYLIHHLVPDFGLMGTIETIIGKDRFANPLTTVDVVTNHKTFRDMREQGLKGVVMEVTSHALDQNRVSGIDFDSGIFTNLSQDHLDYHKTLGNYFKAKQKLFENCHQTIYNRDDPWSEQIERGGITFGIDRSSDLQAKNLRFSLEKTTFDLHYEGTITPIEVPLIGKFNVYNVLAALAAALSKGEPVKSVREKLLTFPGVIGRLERIGNPKGLHVFVDFAHTPEALASVLQTLHGLKMGKILTVFGCGGERDREKRPKMGAIAEKYSDVLIITSDNPRFEDPQLICQEIAAGLSKAPWIEVDRKVAIERAISMAKGEDLVLIAGRGHESFQKIRGRIIPFDDREVARSFFHVNAKR